MLRGKAVVAATFLTLVLLFFSNGTALSPLGTAHAATGTITPVSSGLVASDSLTTGNTASWTFGGSAAGQPGAKFTYSEDPQGLHIGVQSAAGGTWAGYYGVSGNTTAALFHAFLTLAYTTVPDNGFNTGLYVQTWNGDFIDYIGCGATVTPQGYYWVVVQAYGVVVGSQVINTLYQSPANTMPLTQDCTIITNGNNFLKVYLGGSVVVNRNNMTLNMPEPERVYLEPQTSTASSLLTGTYTSYYATTNEGLTVTNAPVGGTAKLVDASNNVLASAPVAANGSATMPVGKYALPISGNIEVFDGSNALVASTPSPTTIWGGSVYTVSSASSTSTTTSTTSATSTTTTASSTTTAAMQTLTQTSSGLFSSDSLTTGNTAQWTFGGDAASQPGAKFTHSEDSQGLHIGVQSPAGGTYSGYFAVSGNTSATLFHAVVTLAYTSVPDNDFNTGLYVQTWDTHYIDYIGCLAVATPQGYFWGVVQSYGVVVGSQVISTLYQSPANTMPLTQDCTIITNGNNYLKVYLGGNVVVNRNNMTLNMPTPFRAYLEPQTSTASSMLSGTYTNYYATTNEGVTVTNAPAGGTAEIVDASSNVLASAPVSANGSSTMPVGKYAFPISGFIKVFDKSNNLVATTTTAVSLWGGDVYAVSSSSTTTSSTTSSTASSTTITTTASTTSTTTSSSSTTSSTTTTSTTSAGEAIALSNLQTTSGTVSKAPFQITISGFNVGTGIDRLLVVGVEANNGYVVSVTFGGVHLTQRVGSFYNNDAEFWYLTNPAGTGDVIVTMSRATSIVVGAYAFSGVNQANPIPTTAANHSTAAGSPTISIATAYQNSWVLDSPSIYGGVALGSSTGAQQWDINVPNAITGASSSRIATSPGQLSCSWTATGGGDLWDDVAIEIQA